MALPVRAGGKDEVVEYEWMRWWVKRVTIRCVAKINKRIVHANEWGGSPNCSRPRDERGGKEMVYLTTHLTNVTYGYKGPLR